MAQVEHAHKKWAKSDQKWRFGDQNKVRWSRKLSLIERGYFLKIGKHVSKKTRSVNCFYFILNYGSSGACSQKMSQIGLKLAIWWPKQSSVIEKIKPHRARILLKIGKHVSKKTRSAQLFLFYPQLWLKWSLLTKNEPNRTKIDDLVTKTMFGNRKN